MITDVFKAETMNFVSNFSKKARVTIDGVTSERDIWKTRVVGDSIKKYVYLVSELGTVTFASLIDDQGRDIQTKDMNVEKYEDGLMIVFQVRLKIEGV